MSRAKKRADIAVVGMACWYPGAQSLTEFWENILAKRQQFRRMPDVRLPLDLYYDAKAQAPDKTYGTEAAVIDGFEFDWRERRVPKKSFESTDMVHWLALDIALKALEDSGLDLKKLQQLQTGVILGNTLTGEWTRTNAMRMRWPYFARVLRETAAAKGLAGPTMDGFIESVEQSFKSVFPAITEDTLSGALSNTIAGRVCNVLDLHGGGYTVDGACSSSLIAVITAAQSLSAGDLDVAFAGGIDISLDTFELIGFAKTGALTTEEMRVYDKRASGFIPGEGCGFVIMKRLDEAVRDGDRIYATLKGWGIASDGKGGLTAPAVSGQASAIGKAYDIAGYGIQDCTFIEGHGTGTTLGDKVEISALVQVLGDNKPAQQIGLTSLKSIVGHTKAAAGVGGFIKAVIGVNQRVAPPMAGVEEPNALFGQTAVHFTPLMEGRRVDPHSIIRAGVSAMGFGGINSHVTLESYGEVQESLRPAVDEDVLLNSHDRSEILVITAATPSLMRRKLEKLHAFVRKISRSELLDLAAHLSQHSKAQEPYRCAIVAPRPEEAYQGIVKALNWLESPLAPFEKREEVFGSCMVTLGHGLKAPRIAFLFPGQGAQRIQMGRKLMARYPWAREHARLADRMTRQRFGFSLLEIMNDDSGSEAAKQRLNNTEYAQPAISLVNGLWLELLGRMGIRPALVGGHSLGELAALHAAGSFDLLTLVEAAAIRGRLMASQEGRPGAMIHLACDATTASMLMAATSGYVAIANRNAPDQTVLSGEEDAVLNVLADAQKRGINGGRLPVSNAFHSDYMKDAANNLAKALNGIDFKPLRLPFISGINGQRWQEPEISQYLSTQILAEVNFVALAATIAAESDLIFEVGPGNILSGLCRRAQGKAKPLTCNPMESKPGADSDFKTCLARAFIGGSPVKWDELYRARFVRPFTSPDEKVFIESPTERPLDLSHIVAESHPEWNAPTIRIPQIVASAAALVQPVPPTSAALVPTIATAPSVVAASPTAGVLPTVIAIVAEQTSFDAQTLKASQRLLDDLNLDSIKVTELIFKISLHYGFEDGLPGQFTNASLAEIADAVSEKLGGSAAIVTVEAVSTTSAASATTAPVVNIVRAATPVPVQVAKKPTIAEISKAKNRAPWTRNFSEVWIPTPLAGSSDAVWQGKNVALVGSAAQHSWLQSLGNHLLRSGAKTELISDAASIKPQLKGYGLILVALRPDDDLTTRVSILSHVAQASLDKGAELCFLQFDDGQFGTNSSAPCIISAKAFAQSLAHERPEMKFTALSFDESRATSLDWLSETLARECGGGKQICVAGYNATAQRLVPQLEADRPSDYRPRKLGLNGGDVVLVTGGAKGITAECAIAMAKMTGAKMALLGSSPHDAAAAQDPSNAISVTLKQFADLGLSARYYTADITNAEAVHATLAAIKADLGRPTVLIHGAGVNHPRPAAIVDKAQALKELGPKVLGLGNLLASLESQYLKLVVGLSSVIGVVGMPGNAWYGVANEALDLAIRNYQRAHPAIHTQTLAYSVWAEVGMGARMGSDKNLEARGIGSITPEEGIKRFIALLQSHGRDQQTVITSRLGSIAQAEPIQVQSPYTINFITDLLHFQQGVEAIVRTTLHPDTHPYLRDHNYKGSLLFPTVFGLEAMGQAVNLVRPLPKHDGFTIENIELTRPIPVSSTGLDIEIYAEAVEGAVGDDIRIRAGIRTPITGYKYDHFAADFVFKPTGPRQVDNLPDFGTEIGIRPAKQLYGSILFQGPRFQRLESFHYLNSDNETKGNTVFRSRQDAQDFSGYILGDPYFRDSLLQSAQIIIPQNQCLPVQIQRLILGPQYSRNSQRTCHTDVYKADAKTYLATIDVFTAEGQVLERMENYRLQYLDKRPEFPKSMDLIPVAGSQAVAAAAPVPADGKDLLAPYRQIAGQLVLDADPNGPQNQSVFIHRFIPDFKTFANLNRSIYFSHIFNWMGAAREMSSIPVLDRIRELTETGKWGLVTNWADIEVLGECRNKNRIVEARLWCGKVGGAKNSSAVLNFDWVSKGDHGIEERIATGRMGFTWVEILDHGIVRPAEFPDYYRDFIATMVAQNDNPDQLLPTKEPYRQLTRGDTLFRALEGPNTAIPLGTKIFETSLFDANLVGNLYFGNYSIWMGKLRDETFFNIIPEYYRGIGERGELTCVRSKIQHLREAMPFDDILVTLGVKALHQNGLELVFEFYKSMKNGAMEKLASADHEIIWAKNNAHGEKEASPLPSAIIEQILALIQNRSDKAAS